MIRKSSGLLVLALILAGSTIVITAGCPAAETQATAEPEAALAGDNTAEAATPTVEGKYMGLSSGPLSQATIADLPDGIAVQAEGLQITRDDIQQFIETRATDPKEKSRLQAESFFVAEQLATEPLLKREAKQWAQEQGQDPDGALIEAHLQHIAEQVTVSDADVRAFYDANKDMVQGASYDQVKEQLRQMVLRQEQQIAVNNYIGGLSKRQEVGVDADFLAKVAPKAFDNPVDKARRSGKPTFVDFGSEGCYACDMMAPIIEELETEMGDRVNIVLIQVPEEQYLSARYGVRSIPMQFIYDDDGREVFNHVGFLSKEAILNELAALGVE